MTTMLVLVVDAPPGALHTDDPVGWTAGYVRGKLLEAGLVVHDVAARPDLLLGCQPPDPGPAGPTEHECPLPWCQARFSQPHLVKMHMRSHQDATCQHCGRTYKLTGMHSHEAHCRSNPANHVEPEPEPRTPRPARDRKAPAPTAVVSTGPALGTPWTPPKRTPVGRTRFDPDRARAAAATSAVGQDLDLFR